MPREGAPLVAIVNYITDLVLLGSDSLLFGYFHIFFKGYVYIY
jgi:hypothetical protein